VPAIYPPSHYLYGREGPTLLWVLASYTMKQLMTLLMILSACTSCNHSQEQEQQLLNHLKDLHEVSRTKGYLAKQVWGVAIQYHKYALTTSSQYRDTYVPDYATALAKMETENDVKAYNARIDSLTILTQKEISRLAEQKPASYDKLLLLNNKVIALSQKARKPSGSSMAVYANELRMLDADIHQLTTALEMQYPRQH